MKQIMGRVVGLKKADAVFQVLAFFVMLLVATQTGLGPFGLYTMGIAQSLSCLSWSLFFIGDTPRYRGGTLIRKVFLVTMVLMVLSLFDAQAFFGLSMFLLFTGPVLGVVYFIITLKEIRFYAVARKPYYLL